MQKLTVILMTFLGLWISVSMKRIPSFAGPYRVLARKVGNETGEYKPTGQFWCRLYTSHPKPRELQYVWGRCNVAMQLSDEHRVEVRISQWSNNQWKRNAFVMKFDRACSSHFYHARFLLQISHPGETKCPLSAYGLREVTNQSFNPEFPQFPIMPYGHFLFTVAYFKGDINIGVLVAEADTVPKL